MYTLSKAHGQRKFRKAFLHCLYPVPPDIPPDEHYFHDDIFKMSASQLRLELGLARQRLMLDQRPGEWLLVRIDRLKEELDHAHAS